MLNSVFLCITRECLSASQQVRVVFAFSVCDDGTEGPLNSPAVGVTVKDGSSTPTPILSPPNVYTSDATEEQPTLTFTFDEPVTVEDLTLTVDNVDEVVVVVGTQEVSGNTVR